MSLVTHISQALFIIYYNSLFFSSYITKSFLRYISISICFNNMCLYFMAHIQIPCQLTLLSQFEVNFEVSIECFQFTGKNIIIKEM